MATETRTTPTPPVGVIESLSQGFETVAGHAALLILPLLLDLLLWAGPRVSFAPAINGFIADYHETLVSLSEKPDPQFESQWQQQSTQMRQALGGTYAQYLPVTSAPTAFAQVIYLVGVISRIIPRDASVSIFPMVGVPSIFASREAEVLPFNYLPQLLVVHNLTEFLAIRSFGFLIGMSLGTLYMMVIAQWVFNGGIDFKGLFQRLPIVALQVVILNIMVSILLTIVLAPFIIIAIGLQIFNEFIAQFTMLIGLLLTLWMSLFIVFTVHGMLMNRRNLFSALWDSVRVVQWNMSSTLLLMLAVVILNMVMGFIWELSGSGSWLSILAIAGNAFASTGLVTATFIFYKDRYRYWREMREALLAELQRRRAQNRTQL